MSDARAARNAAEAAVRTAGGAIGRRQRSAALARARERLVELGALETELAVRQRIVDQAIGTEHLGNLAKLDKAVVEARAVVSAGSVRLEVTSEDGTPVLVDGVPMADGWREASAATSISIGRHATVLVVPPGAGSAAAELKAAEDALAAELSRLGFAS